VTPTCIRCGAPLQLPGRIHAAYHTSVDYCCSECAAGKTCVCQLLVDPRRVPLLRAVR
jgi:hypothetical protein